MFNFTNWIKQCFRGRPSCSGSSRRLSGSAGRVTCLRPRFRKLQLEVLEDRITPTNPSTIEILGPGAGPGLLDATFLLSGSASVTDHTAQTLSIGALKLFSMANPTADISVSADDITFDDLGGSTQTLLTASTHKASFTATDTISFTTTTNTLANSGGDLVFSAGTDLTLAKLTTAGGNITLKADNIAISQAINPGAGTVILEPFTTDRNITLGASANGTLELSDAELGWITSGITQVGVATDTGAITIKGAITRTAQAANRSQTLALVTGDNTANPTANSATAGAIKQSAALSVANLYAQAVGGVQLTNAGNDVVTIAGSVTGGGATKQNNFRLVDDPSVTGTTLAVGTVAGVAGISVAGTNFLELTTTGALTINNNLSADQVGLSADGAVTQATTGAINTTTASGTNKNLELLGAGSDALTNIANSTANIAAEVTNAVSYANAGSLTVAQLNFSDGFGGGNITGVSTTSGAVTLATVNGDLTVNDDVAAGGSNSPVSLTAGNTGTATTLINTADISGSSTSSAIPAATLTADKMNLITRSSSVSATNIVTLQQFTLGVTINLGSTAATELDLSSNELKTITAGTLNVGNAFSGAITISSPLTPAYNLSLTTGFGIKVNSSIAMAADKSLTATALDEITLPNAASDLAATGSGDISLTTSHDISLASGSSVSTEDGDLTLSANQQQNASAGDFIGVLDSGTIQTTGTGALTVMGRGGNDASGSQDGVDVESGGIISGGTNAVTNAVTVTVNGTGGAGAGSSNYGVRVGGPNSIVTSAGGSMPGSVSVTGQGGGSSTAVKSTGNFGVDIEAGGKITAGGLDAVTVQGTGGASAGDDDDGVYVKGGTITSSGKPVTVTGNGGGTSTGTLGGNIGVDVDTSGTITAITTGTVTVNGKGGVSTGNGNVGVEVAGDKATITSTNGTVTITGQGGGTGTSGRSYGVQLGAKGASGTISSGGTAPLTIAADSQNVDATATIQAGTKGDETVNIQTLTAGTPIDLGGKESPGASPLTLALTTSQLQQVVAGTLIIGKTDSGSVTVSADVTLPPNTAAQILTAHDIIFSGGQIVDAGGQLTLQPNGAVIPTTSGTDATASTVTISNGSHLQVNIGGTTPGSNPNTQYAQFNVTGGLVLTGVNLVLTGAYVPRFTATQTDTFTIVSATISVTGALSPPQIDFNGGVTLAVSQGNPVVLTPKFTPQVASGQPVDQVVNAGGAASFTSKANANPLADVRWWFLSSVSGSGWTLLPGDFPVNVTGATATGVNTSTLSIPTTTAALNQFQFKAEWSNTNFASSAFSSTATLRIDYGPTVVQQPALSATTNGIGTATFTAAVIGNPAATAVWQISTDGGNTFNNLPAPLPSAYRVTTTSALTTTDPSHPDTLTTTSTLTITTDALGTLNGDKYRAVFTNTLQGGASRTATTDFGNLIANVPPTITTQPTSQEVNEGFDATFSLQANPGLPASATIQWQYSTDGNTWANLNNGDILNGTTVLGVVSNANGPLIPVSPPVVSPQNPLEIASVSRGLSGYQFRGVVTNSAGLFVNSQAGALTIGTLTVDFAPTVTIQPTSLTFGKGWPASFTAAAADGFPTTSVQWKVFVPGSPGQTVSSPFYNPQAPTTVQWFTDGTMPDSVGYNISITPDSNAQTLTTTISPIAGATTNLNLSTYQAVFSNSPDGNKLPNGNDALPASSTTATLQVNSNLAFKQQSPVSVGFQPVSTAVGDLNGDGLPDVAVLKGNGTVSVLLDKSTVGSQATAFAVQPDFPAGNSGGIAGAIALADMNGDGRPDIIVTDATDGLISVLLNTTNSGATTMTFSAPFIFSVGGPGANSVGLAVEDLNGDGRPDVVTTDSAVNGVTVLVNTTKAGSTMPSFAAMQTFAAGPSPTGVALGDLNGDGRPDIVVAAANGVAVLGNTTDLTKIGATAVSFALQNFATGGAGAASVALADFNGDGRTDIAVGNSNSLNVSVLLNTTSNGSMNFTFGTASTTLNGAGTGTISIGTTTLVVSSNSGFPATTPFDVIIDYGAANAESVVVSNVAGTTWTLKQGTISSHADNATVLLLGSGHSSAIVPTFPVSAQAENWKVVTGDLNGDGVPDIAAVGDLGDAVSVLLNTTSVDVSGGALFTLTFGAPVVFPFGPGGGRMSAAIGDFVFNGVTDLVVSQQTSANVSVLFNNTSATVTLPLEVADFPGYGFQEYNRQAKNWTSITAVDPVTFDDAPNGFVVGYFSGYAVDLYSPFPFTQTIGGMSVTKPYGWRQIAVQGVVPSSLIMDLDGDVFGEFPGYGVFEWKYSLNTANASKNLPETTWQQITPFDPTMLAVDGFGDIVGVFPGYGIQLYRTSTSQWTQISPFTPDLLTMNINGVTVADFPGYGVNEFQLVNLSNKTWTQLTQADADAVTIDPNGNVIADFPGYAIEEYYPWLQTWVPIFSAGPNPNFPNVLLFGVDGTGHVYYEPFSSSYIYDYGLAVPNYIMAADKIGAVAARLAIGDWQTGIEAPF